MAVYNSIEHTSYTSIDDVRDGSPSSFRDLAQYVLDLGAQGVWGKCEVYKYGFTGTGSSSHPASSVQKIMLSDHSIENKPQEDYTLIIKKVDASNPNKGLAGAQFHVQSENGSFSKDVVTGSDGTYKITNLSANTYAITETEGPSGYSVDNASLQYVSLPNSGNNTATVTFTDTVEPSEGESAEGSIQKVDADNPTKGLAGAVIKIYDKANNLVDTIKSDSRGLAVSKPLPLGRYTIRETKAPANYGVSDTELAAYLEHEGQIVSFEVTNKSLSTGVSITKTGPKEATAGQPVNYTFSSIANSSNVRLDNFYWKDTLPAQVRLNTVVTCTYNYPGTYKITYRVNGGEYRTLADNLSTQKNYTLVASAAALGLASNERVTEIMFVFGQAPAGFAQVEAPQLKCTAIAALTAGSSFANVADVGGTYNGVWVQAISRWVTTAYGKATPLPKTGY